MASFAVTNNLDWTVSHRPLVFVGNNGEFVKWDEKVAVVRDDNGCCLGAVSPSYETVQNQDLLAQINPMVEEGLLTIENMGYLSHGAKVFAQAKINQEFRVFGESYNSYITLLNGHIGNASVAIGTTASRVICGNTFAMAYSDLSERYHHRVGVNDRILESTSVLNYVNGCMDAYSTKVEKLASTTCTSGQFRTAMESIYQKEASKMRNIDRLNQLFYGGRGNEGKTFYDCFNAVTEYATHYSRKTADGRFNYSNFGQGSRINIRAMRVLTELASV